MAARAGVSIGVALAGAVLLQLAVGSHLRALRPVIDEFPPAPDKNNLAAVALGDNQFLFRFEMMWLQDFGDGGGRIKPLRDFDYHRVAAWLEAIDGLDAHSDAAFELGSQFFGALTDSRTAPAKVGILIDLFEHAALADPARRWSWLNWAAITERRVVKDPAQAKRLGDDLLRLRGNSDVPGWLPLLAVSMFRVAGDEAEVTRLSTDPDMLERRRRQQEDLKRAESGQSP